MRVGFGYDVHRLEPGRTLVLGGVAIPFSHGLRGHSDADVLTHAVCDALLGAAGLGDIGEHFPDSDPRLEGISSLELLARTCRQVAQAGYRIVNLDATVVAQAPRIAPHREAMRQRLAAAAGIDAACMNVKATTTEGLGPAGRGEGISAYCVALIAAHRP
jgi:2-C-methyl-D-erythritol 2,4-cyclodiphosphate synthase